jgi:hypothetical protein
MQTWIVSRKYNLNFDVSIWRTFYPLLRSNVENERKG